MNISIIIPVLNEERILNKTLSNINLESNMELIVVDGGSTDNTIKIAYNYTDKVFSTEKGRAKQMNLGARHARGDILIFLHADCILPENAFSLIVDTLSRESVVAGAFDIEFDNPSYIYRIIERGANLRSRLTSIIYGDQAMFLRSSTFHSIGGFKDIPLMEDIEISQRLKKIGKIAFLKPPVKVSARRFQKEGPLYTLLRDWFIALQYTIFKVNPERLIRYYRDVR